MNYPLILKCDIAGLPVRWVSWKAAANFYARSRVRWEGGQEKFLLRGGTGASGLQTTMEIGSIIAVADRSRHFHGVPLLTNKALFERDHSLCLYCGDRLSQREGTRDHVMPASRGGLDSWENCVTACTECNSKKDNRTPEEANMKLLAVPYAPSLAEYLIMSNRNILADQMEFLKAFSKKKEKVQKEVPATRRGRRR